MFQFGVEDRRTFRGEYKAACKRDYRNLSLRLIATVHAIREIYYKSERERYIYIYNTMHEYNVRDNV